MDILSVYKDPNNKGVYGAGFRQSSRMFKFVWWAMNLIGRIIICFRDWVAFTNTY